MSTIQCKMCGGMVDLSEGITSRECPYCGTLTTFPKASAPNEEQLYNRAEHYRQVGDFDKAVSCYEELLRQVSDDPEIYWGLVLSRFGIEYVEDPISRERIPTCHRVQFESILTDQDYQKALELSSGREHDLYKAQAERIAELQKQILAISSKEKPYDVFICYKESDESGVRTKDSTLAQDIYYQLANEGMKVFFARITLEDKLGQQYEPYIFAALNSAKVMLVIGSKKEYFNAVWVRNEWSRFLALMHKDNNRLLIPCFRDMDAYDIPEELSMFQSQDMSKIGFVQDLLRGIRKVLGKEMKVSAGATAPAADATPLLKRAMMFLSDKEWKNAGDYANRVLDKIPECGEAFLVLALLDLKFTSPEELHTIPTEKLRQNRNYTRALQYGNNDTKAKLAQQEEIYRKGVEAFHRELQENLDALVAKYEKAKTPAECKALVQQFRELKQRGCTKAEEYVPLCGQKARYCAFQQVAVGYGTAKTPEAYQILAGRLQEFSDIPEAVKMQQDCLVAAEKVDAREKCDSAMASMRHWNYFGAMGKLSDVPSHLIPPGLRKKCLLGVCNTILVLVAVFSVSIGSYFLYNHIMEERRVKAETERQCAIEDALEEAQEAYDEKRWQDAVKAADEVLALDSENEDAHRLKNGAIEDERKEKIDSALLDAQKAFDQGRWQDAVKAADRVLELDEYNNVAQRLRKSAKGNERLSKINGSLDAGKRALRERRWQDAVKSADEVLALDKWNSEAEKLKKRAVEGERQEKVDAKLMVAQTALEEKRWQDAVKAADEALALDGQNRLAQKLKKDARDGEYWEKIAPLMQVVQKALDEKRWEDAVKAADEVLAMDAENEMAQRLKQNAISSERQEKVDAKLLVVQRALDEKRWEDAVKAADEALAIDGKNEMARTLKKEAARLELQEKTDAGFERAQKAMDEKRWEDAVKAADEVLALDSKNAMAQRLKKTAIESERNEKIEANLMLSQKALDEKRWQDAVKAAEAVLAMDARNETAQRLKKRAIESERNEKIEANLILAQKAMDEKRWQDAVLAAGEVKKLDSRNTLAANIERRAAENAKQEKVEKNLIEAQRALDEKRWADVVKAADEVLQIEPRHTMARNLKAKGEEGLHNATIDSCMESAQKAFDEKRWQDVVDAVDVVLLLDGGNSRAKKMRQAALDGALQEKIASSLAEGIRALGEKRWQDAVKCADGVLSLSAGSLEAKALRQNALDGERQEKIAGLLVVVEKALGENDLRGAVEAAEAVLELEPGNARAQEVVRSSRESLKLTFDLAENVKLELTYIAAGNFLMGSPAKEQRRNNDELQHRVNFSSGYWMGIYEVTQEQWEKVVGTNPSNFSSGRMPVVNVSWEDVQAFCRKLNDLYGEKLPQGCRFVLPTEAQWEYACRAGSLGAYFGDALDVVGWYRENSDRAPHEVGTKAPNAWGLYDMHGNVREWCQDWYGAYSAGDQENPQGPASGTKRVTRGGNFGSGARDCRSATRNYDPPSSHSKNLGFRIAVAPVPGL